MARICIVTPGHLASTPRVVKEADALAERGHAVWVVSGRTLVALDPADAAIVQRARWNSKVVNLASGPQWKIRRLAQSTAAIAHAFGLTAASDLANSAATPLLAKAAADVPADLYVAHYIAALPAAAKVAAQHRARYAFDAEDFHAGETLNSNDRESRIVEAIERRWLPGCAYVTAASPGIADAYVETYGIKRPTVVLNVFPLSEAPPAPIAARSAGPGPSIYWFSQTIGPGRGLETAVRAIGLAFSQPHLHVRGMSTRGFHDRLKTLASDLGVAGRLHFLPTAPSVDMARLAAKHDLGLSSEPGHTHNNSIALANKLFTYLLAGIPTLMSDIEAHRVMAGELSGAAILYRREDPDSLAAAIDALLLNSERLARARATAFRLGQERFNWDFEKVKLIELVESLGGQFGHSDF